MFQTLTRLIRHRWLDHTDAARAVPPPLAEQLRRRVHASEQRHSGEVRICVEGGLPTSYLWRHLRDGVAMPDIVRQRALMMFSKLRVWDTSDNNGVLIYLLMADRAIEIVADRGLHRRVSSDVWRRTVDDLAGSLRTGQYEAGLIHALGSVNGLLAQHFPLSDHQPNPDELPNEPSMP